MDEARYSVTVMPDGSVRLYPGRDMRPEDMTPAAVAYAAVVKALEGHES